MHRRRLLLSHELWNYSDIKNKYFLLFSGVPTSLSSDLDIKIYVKNVNDHEPQFLVREFQANFTENLAPGRERVRIIGTIDRDDIDEEDLDEDAMEVCYFVVSSDGPKGLFAIHPTNHELMTTRELDRETRSDYNVMIKATEDCLEIIGKKHAL